MPAPWSNVEQPPALVNPTMIDINGYPTTQSAETDGGKTPAGLVTRINLDPTEDALVFTTETATHPYPLQVTGGRNVIIRGILLRPPTQTGGFPGDLNDNDVNTPNTNPRLPGSSIIRAEQWETTWIEGCHIDGTGHEVDLTSIHNPVGLSDVDAANQRNFMLINTRLENQKSKDSAIHGDITQNRDFTPSRRAGHRFRAENVDMFSIGNGCTIHGGGGGNLHWIKEFKNVYFADGDIATYGKNSRGLLMDDPARSVSYEELYVNWRKDLSGNWDYWKVGGTRYDAGVVPNTFRGAPPGGDFAPAADVGLNYVSPFGATSPFVTRAQRAAVIGVARPWCRTTEPNASLNEEWRASAGFSYGANALAAPPGATFQTAWAANTNVVIQGGSG